MSDNRPVILQVTAPTIPMWKIVLNKHYDVQHAQNPDIPLYWVERIHLWMLLNDDPDDPDSQERDLWGCSLDDINRSEWLHSERHDVLLGHTEVDPALWSSEVRAKWRLHAEKELAVWRRVMAKQAAEVKA